MDISRRNFLLSTGAFALSAGCRSTSLFGKPDLRFGVISDIHVTTENSCRILKKSFKYFKRRGVDCVVIPGDLTDWGTKGSFVLLKNTWDAVFDGTEVKPIFCTGNHDYDGWFYSDMTMEMHANGVSENDAMVKHGFKDSWEELFGEKFEPVRVRSVKGYDFVSVEWRGQNNFKAWMEENSKRFENDKPFFFFQHVPIKGTTRDSSSGGGDDGVKSVLENYHNCVAFTGHTHRTFNFESSIWQGGFSAIAVPSLSYTSMRFAENGSGNRAGLATQTMPPLPLRADHCGGQGYVVNVWNDCIAVERIDLRNETSDCRDWVIPLGDNADKPYDPASLSKKIPAPRFPEGAKVEVETRNTENRVGKWAIVMNCEFPSAVVDGGYRVYDYQIRAVVLDGSQHKMVKTFLSPAFAKQAKFEPLRQRFWFNVNELPQGKRYVLEFTARNCFGKASKPIYSKEMMSVPGFAEVDKSGIKG